MRHLGGRLRLAVLLALPAFVAAHDLIFLATYGARNLGTALSRDGHGPQWMATVVTAAMTGTVLVGVGVWRLLTLAQEARTARRAVAAGRVGHPQRSLSVLARELLILWALVGIGAIAMFVTAENLERIIIGQPAPGLAVLASSQYVDAPLVLAVVAGLVAMVAALYTWERDVLIRRIALAGRWTRRATAMALSRDPFPHRRSLSGVRLAGRAPPLSARVPIQA